MGFLSKVLSNIYKIYNILHVIYVHMCVSCIVEPKQNKLKIDSLVTGVSFLKMSTPV